MLSPYYVLVLDDFKSGALNPPSLSEEKGLRIIEAAFCYK